MAFDVMAFVRRELETPAVPGKRQVKNRSGKAGRKQANGRKWEAAVGGTKSTIRAIYMPADPLEGPAKLCHVVDRDTGLRNGQPFRDPQLGQGVYLAGRGAM